jgi:hypothetical protein
MLTAKARTQKNDKKNAKVKTQNENTQNENPNPKMKTQQKQSTTKLIPPKKIKKNPPGCSWACLLERRRRVQIWTAHCPRG